jgi:hypothetical protein
MLETAGRDSAVVREVSGAGQTEAVRGPQVCKPPGNMVILYFIIKSHKTAKEQAMSGIDPYAFANDEELEESVRPLVNEILERFNQDDVSPSQAGMVILALTYRLLEVLQDTPEARRFFILTLINLINNYLAEEMEEPVG